MCRDYKFIAMGGFAKVREMKPQDYKYVNWFTRTAADHGTKVHGLGFTNKEFQKYGFYSVDSSNWLAGRRYGAVYRFNGKTIESIAVPDGKRGIYKSLEKYNFPQWVQYQRYLDRQGDVL